MEEGNWRGEKDAVGGDVRVRLVGGHVMAGLGLAHIGGCQFHQHSTVEVYSDNLSIILVLAGID